MDVNFFYYSVYDRFIQRQPCVCMFAFANFFFKNFFSDTIDWIFTKFHRNVPLKEVKNFSGLWSDTGAQAPVVIKFETVVCKLFQFERRGFIRLKLVNCLLGLCHTILTLNSIGENGF